VTFHCSLRIFFTKIGVLHLKVPDFHQFMTKLVETWRYQLVGRGFDYKLSQGGFALINSFRLHQNLGVLSASNSNEYQKYLLFCTGGHCVGLSSLLPSCPDCLEIL